MKKLKRWQFITLLVIYPIGIFYFIYWLMVKSDERKAKKIKPRVSYVPKALDDDQDDVDKEYEEADDEDKDDDDDDDDDEDYDDDEDDTSVFFKVVGVTFNNDDGTSRQENLKQLRYVRKAERKAEIVPYDYNGKLAYYVLMNGKCVGNVPKELTHKMAGYLENKTNLTARIYGGNKRKDGISNYGANIVIVLVNTHATT